MKDETKCLHAGYQPKNAEPRVMPIVQSTTYVYDSTEEVAAVFDDPMKSLIYSRFGNPTVMAVEDKIAELEGGIGAMCTTSGQAAVLLSLLNICNAGDSFISTMEIYGGSVNLFSHTLRRMGIECIYIDKNATDEEIDAAFQSNTKAVFGETIANPALTVAEYLERSDRVEKVNYPGLKSDENYGLARKYLSGCSGVISFVIKGGKETAIKFMNKLQLASNEVHVSDIRTCVLHPASETHRQLTDEQLVAAGIEQGLVRLSVGLENVEDIIADLEQAFSEL